MLRQVLHRPSHHPIRIQFLQSGEKIYQNYLKPAEWNYCFCEHQFGPLFRAELSLLSCLHEFPSQTPKNGAPTGSGRHPPGTKKIAKKYLLNFSFFSIGTCKGMFELIEKHFLRQDFSFFRSYLYVVKDVALSQYTSKWE